MIDWGSAKRVLVIKLRHHGDVLLMTPLLASLKKLNYEIQVDTLVYEETAPLLMNNPDVNRVISVSRTSGKSTWQKIKALSTQIKQLRANQYDKVILLTNQWRGALYVKLIGAPISITLDFARRSDSRLWANCFTHQVDMPVKEHSVDIDLAVLRKTGVAVEHRFASPSLVFNPTSDEKLSVEKVLSDSGVTSEYVVVHPGSRWFIKCWEDERYAEVIDAFSDKGYQVVLTGAPDRKERALIDSIIKYCKTEPINLCGQFSLRQMGEVIRRASFMFGVDSLPAHLAAAVNTPSLVLFGPSKLWEWKPWSDSVEVINARDYAELPANNDIDTKSDIRYLYPIQSELVLDKVDSIFSQLKKHQSKD